MPPATDKLILITDIQSVAFGSANRNGSSCFVSLKVLSGDLFKSTAIPQRTDYCKNKRKELVSVLGVKK